MELVLESTEGVPPGSVVSIKIGEVRRQAPVDKLGQSFRFTSSPVEALPMRVEVFVPVAPPKSIMLDPVQKQVDVDLGRGGMKLKMRKEAVASLQRPIPDVGQIAASRTPEDKKDMATQAASYLEQHGLVRTFQDLLHGLLVSKPDDPWLYLDEHLARAKAVAQKAGPPPPAVSATPKKKQSASRGSIISRSKVDALLEILQKTQENMPLIVPYLPTAMSDMLQSEELVQECHRQFVELDQTKEGFLRPEELLPVIVQLSTANSIDDVQCRKFCNLFDTNQDGKISVDEFVNLTRFVIIAAHLESDEGKDLMNRVQGQDETFKKFLNVLETDKDRINDVVPFLPDWLVDHLTSEAFLDECMTNFDSLDADKNGQLSPDEVVPIVINLSKVDEGTIDMEKCKKFVSVFDVHRNGVIQRDEFLEFAQFLAVTNFLSSTTEGQQIHEAALHQSELRRCDELIKKLEEGIANLPAVIESMPRSIKEEIMSQGFTKECVEGFQKLDVNGNGVLDPIELFPLIIQMCGGHPINVDYEACKQFTAIFDKDRNGVISLKEFANLCRFVIVMGYLQFTKQWRESTVHHSRQQIEDLLDIMREHRERLHEILPLLPDQLHQEITSDAFTKECLDYFTNLDKDRSGSLEPKELVPVVIAICQAHPVALTKDQCMRFVDFFDTERTGVISKNEFIDFVRFMMVMSYLESENANTGAPEPTPPKVPPPVSPVQDSDFRQVEELLTMLETDRASIQKVIPLLPEDVFNDVTGDQFTLQCEERFQELDKDGNGTLDPSELYPVIVELSDAHPYAIDMEHCKQFTAIFDVHGDGVIRKDEFVDFARFLVIMSYLHSDEGQAQVSHGVQIMDGSRQIEDLIRALERDRHELRKVIPFLPVELRDELLGTAFIDQCRARFKELDQNGSGSLEPHELYPVILEMTDAHHYALDSEQCKRFTAIFDDEKTGVISQSEFVNFARFLMVMSYLQTEGGQNALERAQQESQSTTVAQASSSSRSKAPKPLSPKADTPSRSRRGSPQSTSSRRVLSPKAEVGHLSVDRDYYRGRAQELGMENQVQRRKMLEMEEKMRLMQEELARRDLTLRHAQVDLEDLNASR